MFMSLILFFSHMPLKTTYTEQELPQEKLLEKGSVALTTVELLALILRTGTKKGDVLTLSRNVLRLLEQNKTPSIHELRQIDGVHTTKAAQILALLELSRRLLKPEKNEPLKLCSAKAIYEYIVHDFTNKPCEETKIILVNAKLQPKATLTLSEGSVAEANIDKHKLIRHLINSNAHAFFLLHNHPSGDPTPSLADKETTSNVKQIAQVIGVPLLDHIIIAQDKYFSFYDNEEL